VDYGALLPLLLQLQVERAVQQFQVLPVEQAVERYQLTGHQSLRRRPVGRSTKR
jgi:hypothetical protein